MPDPCQNARAVGHRDAHERCKRPSVRPSCNSPRQTDRAHRTLSRWRHGLESRWGGASHIGPGDRPRIDSGAFVVPVQSRPSRQMRARKCRPSGEGVPSLMTRSALLLATAKENRYPVCVRAPELPPPPDASRRRCRHDDRGEVAVPADHPRRGVPTGRLRRVLVVQRAPPGDLRAVGDAEAP